MPRKEYRCDCAKHCKIVTGKKVSKSTYFAHANFRKSLSPIPGGFQIGQNPAGQVEELLGQAPPIAELLAGYPEINLDAENAPQAEVRMHVDYILGQI